MTSSSLFGQPLFLRFIYSIAEIILINRGKYVSFDLVINQTKKYEKTNLFGDYTYNVYFL